MKNNVKKLIPLPIKNILKFIIKTVVCFGWFIKRKLKKSLKRFFVFRKEKYTFVILCIKKEVYADMAIDNANSLHYFNCNHNFVFYCDSICFDYLTKRFNRFDYPEKIKIINAYSVADKAWQYYKIDVHIQAAKNGQIDTDADAIWHEDPVIDREKMTMLVLQKRNEKDSQIDTFILERVCNIKKGDNFVMGVSAFVSMPKRFMTDQVAYDLRKYNDMIFTHPLDFFEIDLERVLNRRLSEQYAVNIAFQKNFPGEKIITLKLEDGRGNKKILESFYYGWVNKVVE